MAGAFDLFVAYKFVKILTTPWEEQEAFALGIIDDKGNFIRKSKSLKTNKERKSFTVFHRLIFNLKKILEKSPFGKSKLITFTAGLFLIKESEDDISFDNFDWDELERDLPSFKKFITENPNVLDKGEYKLVNDVFAGEKKIGKLGDIIVVKQDIRSVGELLGQPVFDVFHQKTRETIKISLEDIIEI